LILLLFQKAPSADDPFGSADPFSARSGSPAPDLPPKKGQTGPPPRPVVPKNNKSKANEDPFKAGDPWADSGSDAPKPQEGFDPFGGGASSNSNNFANFANFE